MFHLQDSFMTKMNLFIWAVLSNLLFGCYMTENKNDSNHFVVVGTAVNLKLGAGVISNERVYYLDEVESWEEKNLEKRVRVEGELFVKILPPLPLLDTTQIPPPPPPQRIPNGFELIIKEPTWELVK
jgi:hypothetical protein